jgi:CheY-like chemotaxis protein
MNLLLIDDDEAIRTLIHAIFRRNDVVVDSAADGAAALERLRRREYDAILLDLMLPGVNGFEVIRDLKSRNPKLLDRTIVLTAASDRTLRDFTDGRLVRRVMRKPFDVGDLMREVLAMEPAH